MKKFPLKGSELLKSSEPCRLNLIKPYPHQWFVPVNSFQKRDFCNL